MTACPIDHGRYVSGHDLVPIVNPHGRLWECPVEGQRWIEAPRGTKPSDVNRPGVARPRHQLEEDET